MDPIQPRREPKVLSVSRVSRIGPHQVALHVTDTAGVDLQYVYRAGHWARWNSEADCLEDHFELEDSTPASFQRIRMALLGEMGVALVPADGMEWIGIELEDRQAIERAWRL
jgi:hypothetical protein